MTYGPLSLETLIARANREGERLILIARIKYIKSVLLACRASKKKVKEDFSEIETKLNKLQQIKNSIRYKTQTKNREQWEAIKKDTEEALDLL